MAAPLRLAIATVRAWTRLYTWGMAPDVADARRAEIESDLWEFQHDPQTSPGLSAAVHVFLRLAAGVPDDLAWRVEYAAGGQSSRRRKVALTVGAAVISAALWFVIVSTSAELPQLPKSPPVAPIRWRAHGPPPPPPPPPCPPPAFRTGAVRDCTP